MVEKRVEESAAKPPEFKTGDRVRHFRGSVGTVIGPDKTKGWIHVRWDGKRASVVLMAKTLELLAREGN